VQTAGIGAEVMLDELVRSTVDDETWIQSVEAAGARLTDRQVQPSGTAAGALILLEH
jgi:hypothetical protein